MLQFFRKGLSTKFGAALALGVLLLIALAFAAGDVSSGVFGGVTGGDRIATVGGERIGNAELERAATATVENMRKSNPGLTMRSFIAQGGLDYLISNLADRRAALKFGENHGIYIGSRLIDSEIAKIPLVRGPDGKVDSNLYRQFLVQQGITDGQFRDEISQELMARLLFTSVQTGVRVPKAQVLRLAGIYGERRTGAIVTLPSAAFAPKTAPSQSEIAGWYQSHSADYLQPERRVIRYVVIDDGAVKSLPAPTEVEIAARYKASADKYAPSDKRRITQLVVPDEAMAKAMMAQLAAGKSLDAVAAPKGLGVAALGALTRDAYALQSNDATADAVFVAPKGKVVGPFKAPLGWLLVRIDGVEHNPGKTLAQARAEILAALTVEKRQAALGDLASRIDDEFNNGAALGEVAKEFGLAPVSTEPLLANGAVFAKPGQSAPPVLAKVVPGAFAMDGEGKPQLDPLEAGKLFIAYDVSHIDPAAPPPLAAIRDRVIEDIQLAKGTKAAEEAAKKVEAALAKGVPLNLAVSSLGLALPPIDKVDLTRVQLRAMGTNAPPPVQMLFAMAKGKTKRMGAPRNHGWYVLTLDDVVPGKVDPADPLLKDLAASLEAATGNEYYGQLRAALRDEVGVKRNEAAIAAVRKRLLGGS